MSNMLKQMSPQNAAYSIVKQNLQNRQRNKTAETMGTHETKKGKATFVKK